MATYCASVLISELRKQRGLSQEKLAEGICDRRTISYIENGSISPSKFIFERLMQRLGVEPQRFSSYISSKAEMKFEDTKHRIYQLLREKNNEEIEILLKDLEEDKVLKNNKFVLQYIMKTRAWILAGGMDWHNASDTGLLGLLNKAIKMTIESFDSNNIKGELYTLIEIDLIRMIGLLKLYTGEKEKALQIFLDIEALINTGYIYMNDIAGAYTSLLVSMAKCYRWHKKYDDALITSDRGLSICIDGGEYHTIPWLLYQKASALYWLGDSNKSLEIFNEAVIIARNYKEIEMTGFLEERKQDLLDGNF